jgi:hypothetical protein
MRNFSNWRCPKQPRGVGRAFSIMLLAQGLAYVSGQFPCALKAKDHIWRVDSLAVCHEIKAYAHRFASRTKL